MNDADIKAYGQSWYVATMVDEPRRPRLAVAVALAGFGAFGLGVAQQHQSAHDGMLPLEPV